MCLTEKVSVDFNKNIRFCGYKIFFIDRNGLLVSPFVESKKIPFSVIYDITCIPTDDYCGFYSFLNKDAGDKIIEQGSDQWYIESGPLINVKVKCSDVKYFGVLKSQAAIISNRISVDLDLDELTNIISNNSYFNDKARSIIQMSSYLAYNDYVRSFTNYDFYRDGK